MKFDLQARTYTPNRLFEKVAECLGAGTDAELARVLNCAQAQLSRMRKRKDPISAAMMVKVMDRTDWTVKQVRALAGMPVEDIAPQPRNAPKPPPPQFKITDAQVREIRARKGPVSLTAELYGISDRYVQLIQSGKARREVAHG